LLPLSEPTAARPLAYGLQEVRPNPHWTRVYGVEEVRPNPHWTRVYGVQEVLESVALGPWMDRFYALPCFALQ